jgi:transcriptional regulator with GAF, ATPase, and Fis domain
MDEYLSFDDVRELSLNRTVKIDTKGAIEAFQRKALSGIEPEHLLEFVFEALEVFIPFDRVGLALSDGEWLRAKWVKSKAPVKYLTTGYAARIKGSSLAQVLDSGKPRVIGDLELYLKDHPNSHSTSLIVKDGIRSSLTFPLQLHESAFGVVFFSSTKPHAYNLEHLRLLELVSQGLSTVVEQYQLRQLKTKTSDQDRTLSRVSHDMRSPLSVIAGFADLLSESPDYERLSETSKNTLQSFRVTPSFFYRWRMTLRTLKI